MEERNLPIKLIMQKSEDSVNNEGRGGTKFFCDVTDQLKDSIISSFSEISSYYENLFQENERVPAVGVITVKPEAIAKSYKPNDLCRKCPIIGSEELGEIYIKVSKKSIAETIELIKNPPSQKFSANLTAISEIQPVKAENKISQSLIKIQQAGNFDMIKNAIKIKLFDFQDDFDNEQILNYVMSKLSEMGYANSHQIITYGEDIKFIKIAINSYDDIVNISSINGVKTIDFFQEYSLPITDMSKDKIDMLVDVSGGDSEVVIGIIDGGIGNDNPYLTPYIIGTETYVDKNYQNHMHASFIASTIQYGNELNELPSDDHRRFKFLDVIAIPNSDEDYGPVDSIGEDELMEIIEEVMEKHSSYVKIWNLSLGIPNQICDGSMSDLGIFLDYIQDKYSVQVFVSSGNLQILPLRNWPPQDEMGERDRIIAPADSVRAITVGSIALYDSDESIVKKDEPSPFSRRGPGANNTIKPDVVDYGGNYSKTFSVKNHGMKGMTPAGEVIEGNGTSYSTPRVLRKYATILDEMVEKDRLIAKALLIHSARMNYRELIDNDPNNIKYYGFGMPFNDTKNVLQCTKSEITMIFKQKIVQGTHLEMMDFPYPKSLIKDGKCYGEIGMTLVYNPSLDENYGREYCRANIDASFGMYKYDGANLSYSGCVPLECAWDEKYEKARVENGFKWSPIKSYYRKIKQGISMGDGWKVRIDLNARNETNIPEQEFVLVITIRDPGRNDIYTEVTNSLREKGYITNDLKTRYQIRQRG